MKYKVYHVVFFIVCIFCINSNVHAEQYSKEQSMELVKQQFITEIINKTGNPVVYSNYGLSQDEAKSCFYDAVDECADLMYIGGSYYISETDISGYLKSEDELSVAICKQEALKNKVSEVVSLTDGKSDYEKVSIIYNWLCDNCTYNGYSCDIYDAMLNGGTNCVGFSSTFNYLCMQAGLETHRVWSPTHLFSQVKVDGEWYNCDVTWDIDKEEKLYFLCSDEKFLLSHESIIQSNGCISKKYDYIKKEENNNEQKNEDTEKVEECTNQNIKSNLKDGTNGIDNIKNAKARVKSIKKKGKTITLKIKRNKGYKHQIKVSIDKKFKKYVKTYNTNKVLYKVGSLKKGSVYYIKIRPYKKVDGKIIYGKWSRVRKVRVK